MATAANTKIVWPHPTAEMLGFTLADNPGKGGKFYMRSDEFGSSFRLYVGPAYLMNCCGAAEIQGLSGFVSGRTALDIERHIQETMLVLYNLFSSLPQTHYGIAATSQMGSKDGKGHILSLLFELGAKEVFSSPNRNHGPNHMHLIVLDPYAIPRETIQKKYFWRTPNGVFVPKYIESLSEAEKQAIVDSWGKQAEEAAKKAQLSKARRAQQQWNTATATINQLLYTEHQRLYTIYGNSPLGEAFQKSLDYLKTTIRAYGWSNKNDDDAKKQSSVSTNGNVGPAQDSIWQTTRVVQSER